MVIDVKLERFQAADKGQMELYLQWLEKYEMRPSEEPPLGLILCADKSEEHAELLQLDKSGIRVAQYLTELPPRELLEKTLHDFEPAGPRAAGSHNFTARMPLTSGRGGIAAPGC